MVSAGEIWDELAAVGNWVESEGGWHLRRILPNADNDIFVALRHPGAVPALLVEVDATAVRIAGEYPSARGFELYPESVTPGPRGRARLCLVLVDDRYREVFEVLVNDVGERIARVPGQEEAVKTLIARLHVWQNFMRRHGVQGLTVEAQIGLFGELTFLADHLIDRLPAHDSVEAWRGPAGGSQDFDISGRCVEVKTTTVIPPISVTIANMTQLDETLVDLLLLCHTSLVLDGRNGESLPQVVDRLRTNLTAQDVSALDEFNAKLIEAGYLDSHCELYSDTRYSSRKVTFFRVNAGFPRITADDLRAGIAACSYSIVLAACSPYELEAADAVALLLNEGERG